MNNFSEPVKIVKVIVCIDQRFTRMVKCGYGGRPIITFDKGADIPLEYIFATATVTAANAGTLITRPKGKLMLY